jgi:VanZ family protein
MATSATLLNPTRVAPQQAVRAAWFSVLGAILFAFTSTTLLSGYHTGLVVNYVWHSLFGSWHLNATGPVNWFGRKIGHFLGYGTIGLMFRKAWYTSIRGYLLALRSHIMVFSAAFGVLSTFALASLDEWHQMYLPQRHGSMYDALLDASGAIFLNLVASAVWTLRRRRSIRTWN